MPCDRHGPAGSAGDQEHVTLEHRAYVEEPDDVLLLEDERGVDRTGDDAAEQALIVHESITSHGWA